MKSDAFKRWPKLKHLQKGSIIVYVQTQQEAEALASNLTASGVRCSPYHAGMSLHHREKIQVPPLSFLPGIEN